MNYPENSDKATKYNDISGVSGGIRLLRAIVFLGLLATLFLQGCTSVNTFPTVARAGDTISVMVGGTENARKDTVAVTFTDANSQVWDLAALGLVRSVFNLRTDGVATGLHYSPYIDSQISWTSGHEPIQAVLVADIPAGAAIGAGTLDINTGVSDDSSGVSSPTVNIEVIAGTGQSDQFDRQDFGGGSIPVDFADLEPAPHAKISFGADAAGVNRIGAVSMVVDFDENVVNAADINVYVPVSNVRGSFTQTGQFGDNQRMVYWHQDGQQLFIDVVSPKGIYGAYLKVYVVHPTGLVGSPALSLVSANLYDLNGDPMTAVTPTLEYKP